MKFTVGLLLLALSSSVGLARENGRRDARTWERSAVALEVTRQVYDYFQPWSRQSQPVLKAGVLIGPRQILTTALDLDDSTLIRAQKGGRGRWWDAEVEWADYLANVALVTVREPGFWEGLRPVALARSIPAGTAARIVRWSAGTLEMRKAEFNRFAVSNPGLTDAAHVFLELSADVAGAGWGEPAVDGNKVLGLVFAQTGNLCQVLPAPFIGSILEARARGIYQGLGYFDFTWQPTENPDTHRYLRLEGEPRGVVVIEVPKKPGVEPVLKPRDILLEVDGFSIDIQGDYVDPDYGHLLLENLSTRKHWAGDTIRLRIWRDGRELEVGYTLPRAESAARLVPEAPYGQPPDYLVLGGLVFQPLTRNYLRSWGADWERRAPFRLAYFRTEEPSPERPSIVILSQVLPDVFNLGYQDVRHLVVERLNGRRITDLRDLVQAVAEARDGFHVLEFMTGDSLQRLVLDTRQLEPATRRVLQVYGIDKDRVLRE
jgi:hypothetical protein